MFHQANQYAAPLKKPPEDKLYSRLDEPSEMKGSPQAVHKAKACSLVLAGV